jgi:hypothetical protein
LVGIVHHHPDDACISVAASHSIREVIGDFAEQRAGCR